MDAALCVVGLGGTGLTLIEEALDRGIGPVVGIDAADVGAGAAGRNGGLLLAGTVEFHHDAVRTLGREEALRWAQRTADEIDRFVARYPGLVRRSGSLRIAGSAQEIDDCEVQYQQMVADDLPVERYRGPEGEGLLFPQDAVFDPLARCRAQATALLARGARLFGGTRAHEVAPGMVHCDGGRVRARHVVVCVDGALERVLPALTGEVRTARLQMLATAPVAPRFPRPVYRRYGYDYWQQLPDGSICLGGGRDTTPDTEWTHDGSPSATIQDYLDRTLRDTLGVQASVTHRWAALVGYTGTGLPLCRRLDDGLWALGGYSGTGNVVGAVLAREVAAALAR
jgi:gamma-glutamylputrescine oxidase